jgi:CheY-like chemotaxis protein
MRLLFLDDDPQRHWWFRTLTSSSYTVYHCYSAHECIEALKRLERFDVVYLDHDLDPYASMGFDPLEPTGQAAAQFIAQLPKEKLPTEIIVHSWNDYGSGRMMSVLKKLPVALRREPFDFSPDPRWLPGGQHLPLRLRV